ncbi:hypothetical protein [Thiothrix lacustris]|uniref:hypothetical protein n=1 Tax=Thiothrix lacustris TaxID=525917 RepID=UPI0027E4835B|nr:hypothetical protein [Thiothrix lacustris]WMP18999.1 hypothetical protein RCS87_08020 [Thiothrix lacustris]
MWFAALTGASNTYRDVQAGCGTIAPRVGGVCIENFGAEQQFAANLRDSIQQQTSRLLEHAGMMQDVEIQ